MMQGQLLAALVVGRMRRTAVTSTQRKNCPGLCTYMQATSGKRSAAAAYLNHVVHVASGRSQHGAVVDGPNNSPGVGFPACDMVQLSSTKASIVGGYPEPSLLNYPTCDAAPTQSTVSNGDFNGYDPALCSPAPLDSQFKTHEGYQGKTNAQRANITISSDTVVTHLQALVQDLEGSDNRQSQEK